MAFMLICYDATRLQFESDDHHRFQFDIVSDQDGRRLLVGDAHWKDGLEPLNSSHLLQDASRFASFCAEDFGLR